MNRGPSQKPNTINIKLNFNYFLSIWKLYHWTQNIYVMIAGVILVDAAVTNINNLVSSSNLFRLTHIKNKSNCVKSGHHAGWGTVEWVSITFL